MSKKRKKKKASKKRRTDQTRDQSPSTAEVVGEIGDALDRGRARQAWGLALPLLHQSDLGANERDIVKKTVAVRAREMVEEGAGRQAWEMVENACQGSWLSLEDLDSETRLMLECAGGRPSLLNSYGDDEAVREAADAVVRRTGSLLVQLSGHPELASDHPLRLQAGIVYDAWVELEDTVAGNAYDRLCTLPPQSPFRDWVRFVQALKSYYQRDDEAAEAALSEIEAASAAALLGEALADLMAGSPRNDRWFKKLRESATQEGVAIADLKTLAALYDDAPLVDLCREAGPIAQTLQRQGHRSLACDLYAMTFNRVLSEVDSEKEAPRYMVHLMHMRSNSELIGARIDRFTRGDQQESWRLVLDKEPAAVSSLEQALILNRIAEILMETDEDHAYNADFDPARRAEDEPDEECDPVAIPSTLDPVEAVYLESAQAHPLRQTFQAWCNWRRLRKYSTLDVLVQWLSYLPADTVALASTVREACRCGDIGAGRKAFEALKRIEKDPSALRSLEQFLLLCEAGSAFDDGNVELGEEILDSLDADNSTVQIAAQCIRYATPDDDHREMKRAAGEVLTALEEPYIVWHCFRLLGWRPRSFLPDSVQRQFKDPDLVVRSYLDLATIDDPEWCLKGEVWSWDLATSAAKAGPSSELLLQCLEQMYQADPHLQDLILHDFAAICLAGARRKDEHLSDFIAYRAAAYHAINITRRMYSDPTRLAHLCLDCLMAAWHLATKRGRGQELVQKLATEMGYPDFKEAAAQRSPKDIRAIVSAVRKAKQPFSEWAFDWHPEDKRLDPNGLPYRLKDTMDRLMQFKRFNDEEKQELVDDLNKVMQELGVLDKLREAHDEQNGS